MLDADEVPHAAEKGTVTVRAAPVQPGVRRYRVKRDFDEIDRSDFREAAFGVIRDYFERANACGARGFLDERLSVDDLAALFPEEEDLIEELGEGSVS